MYHRESKISFQERQSVKGNSLFTTPYCKNSFKSSLDKSFLAKKIEGQFKCLRCKWVSEWNLGTLQPSGEGTANQEHKVQGHFTPLPHKYVTKLCLSTNICIAVDGLDCIPRQTLQF